VNIDKECEHCRFFKDRYCSKHNNPVSGYDYCNDFKQRTNHEVVELIESEPNKKEINNKYKTAITKDIFFITLVAISCFTIGLTIGIAIAG